MKKFTEGQTFTQPHDKMIPIMFTGKTKTTTGMGDTIQWFQFTEIITKKNKNWCKGETFWSQGSNFY